MRSLFMLGVLLTASLPASADTWTVVHQESQLGFVGSQGGQRFEGSFGDWTASIAFDPANPQDAEVAVEIRMASAATGDGTRDSALPQPDWFHVAAHPDARFKTNDIRALGVDRYEAHGTLTIRGNARPVILPFTLDIEDDTAKMAGALSIVRTDYGVGQGQFSAGDVVGLDVEIVVDLTATR